MPGTPLVDENCEIIIRDQNLEDDGELRNIIKFDATLKLNDVSAWQMEMHTEDYLACNLQLGAGIIFRRDSEQILSGPVTLVRHHYLAGLRTTSIYGGDDNYWLKTRVCYPLVSGMIQVDGIYRFTRRISANGLTTTLTKATVIGDKSMEVNDATGFQWGATLGVVYHMGGISGPTVKPEAIDYPKNVIYIDGTFATAYPIGTPVVQTGYWDKFYQTDVIDDPTYRGYDTRIGHAEAVMKELVYFNAGKGACVDKFGQRAIPHLVVAPTYDRGNTVTSNARGEELLAHLQNIANVGGICFQLKQVDNELVFDVWKGKDHTLQEELIFSVEHGNLKEYEFALGEPDANMLIAVGPNAGPLKLMLPSANEASIAQFGRFEEWENAISSSEKATNEQIVAAMEASNNAALLTKAYSSSISISLQETDQVRYPRDFQLGDNVRIMIGQEPTDQIVKSIFYSIPAGSAGGSGSAIGAFSKLQMSRVMTRLRRQGDLIKQLMMT